VLILSFSLYTLPPLAEKGRSKLRGTITIVQEEDLQGTNALILNAALSHSLNFNRGATFFAVEGVRTAKSIYSNPSSFRGGFSH